MHSARSVVEREEPALPDDGEVVITDRRVVFAGNRQTLEFRFDKLMAMRPSVDSSTLPATMHMLLLPVENRVRHQVWHGPRADNEGHLEITTALTNFGVALGRGDAPDYLARLDEDFDRARRDIARCSVATGPT